MAFKLADFVKETTTSTGTGSIALAGAATGYQAFSAKMTIGDTTTYSIRAVDGTGAPTGEWELVGGTYTGVNTLSRDTVLASSNSDAAVSFSAGTKEVYITMPSMRAAWIRERLTADRTYYVRTDGSDSNTGLADTSGGAFLTIQKAIDAAAAIDLGPYSVTIQLGDATYTSANILKRCVGGGSVTIKGNSGTPANVLISVTGADCFLGENVGTKYIIKDMKVASTSGSGFSIIGGSTYVEYSNIDFGSCTNHIYARNGAYAKALGNCSISGGATYHIRAQTLGSISLGTSLTFTLTGTPAFSSGFCYSSQLAVVQLYLTTFSGTATGTRYVCELNGVINTYGSGATFLPGNAAGTTATGGQYA